jgi:predicted esterase
MRPAVFACLTVLLTAACGSALPAGMTCDSDTNCLYVPARVRSAAARVPALVVLSCTGAMPVDLDTVRVVGDSLNWVMATCHRTRNHRDMQLNDRDIVRTIAKLLRHPKVDSSRVFLFGFSGQGVQALATMLLHPELVRGVVAVCPHSQAMALADWDLLSGRLVYLVTREKDWNRHACETMFQQFMEHGVQAQLRVTRGEHGPGPKAELLSGCVWLNQSSRP